MQHMENSCPPQAQVLPMAPKGIGAGTAAGATPTNTAAGAAGGDGTGPTAIQVLDELQTAVPE